MCTATTPSPPLSFQRFPVGVGQFGRRRARRRGVTVMDVAGNLIDAVAKVLAVQKDMQRHLANTAPLQLFGLQQRTTSR